MSAVPPGPSGPPAPGRLSRAQRACLLRASRKQLEEYTSALDRLMANSASDADIEAMTAEIRCVQGAIRWLWKDALPSDP